MSIQVLIAEPDRAQTESWRAALEAEGCKVTVAATEPELIEAASRHPFGLVVVDVRLLDREQASLPDMLRRRSPHVHLVVVASRQDVELAVPLLKRGADQVLLRPVAPTDVVNELRKLGAEAAVTGAEAAPSEHDDQPFEYHGIVGRSQIMRKVLRLVTRVAPTDSTVVITGETGVGKEVVAQIIQQLSPRATRPFVSVNCGAIPPLLVESELFGHKRGAFTDAHADKKGLLEIAHQGTLLLDEIGDLPAAAQVKLLRALEEGEIRRVGETQPVQVDVRVLAATNRDLAEDVRQGRFREDLWFRLNVVQIHIPALRERREDIPPLMAKFLNDSNRKFRRSVVGFAPEALAVVGRYDFPGNIRELRNLVEHAVVLAERQVIRVEDLPLQVVAGASRHRLLGTGTDSAPAASAPPADGFKTIAEAEKDLIQWTLQRLEGNQTEVAKRLGISRSTLWRKIKEYKLTV